MSEILAEIKKVNRVLNNNQLSIPTYQRPYRWKEKNTASLLEDIFEAWQIGQQSYRIGALILHKDKNVYHIVDGQQRITTLLLILNVLGNELALPHINQLQYPHVDSYENIKLNYAFIEKWLFNNIDKNRKEFSVFLTEHCEMVEITVSELTEAFQMFDSQNGRGKELEAYNLLKAYHIRAMEDEPQITQIYLDQRWENSTRVLSKNNGIGDVLGQIFAEQLYRTRVWSRREEALSFKKKDIEEFKGFNIFSKGNAQYPLHNSYFLQLLAMRHLKQTGANVKGIKNRFNYNVEDDIDPFVLLNQEFINGKLFFDYVETYNQIYQRLFLDKYDNELIEFKQFYQRQCLYKNNRVGDGYLCEVYKSLIFLLFDKFGEDGLTKYYKILYALVYRNRLEKIQVKYDFVAKNKKIIEAFFIINNAKSYLHLSELEKNANQAIKLRKNVSEIEAFFKGRGIILKEE